MFLAAVAIATAMPVALGLLVVCRSDRHAIGWLLVAHGLSVGVLLAGSGAVAGDTAFLVADQLTQGSWIFLFLWLALIGYLLPDGRTLSPAWRRWICVGLVGAVLFLVGAAGDRSGFETQHHGQAVPLTWLPEPVADLLGLVGLVLVVALFFGSALAVRSRLRRSSGEERLPLLWLVWGALAVPAGLLCMWADYFVLGGQEWFANVVVIAVSLTLPTVIAVAVLRYRLFDIQLLLSRTLTYGALVVGVVAIYALLLLAAGWLGSSWADGGRLGGSVTIAGLLAVAAVAVAVHPAQSWLRQRIERWVYGYRSQPHQALRLLAERADAAEPDALVPAVTEAVREALRVDRVWVASDPAHDGERAVRIPLVHRGEGLGDLAVEVPPGRRLSAADLALLRDLARYAAVLVRSEGQRDELRESRSRIVAAREEERRRLRRDLHDGVGPSLAAIVLKLNAAESRAPGVDRSALVAEAREEVREAITEVRRLVDDLRPPAIDEVGLLAAIRQRAAALSGDVTIEVAGPEPMPPLPAAVEVAAFRIASEAMANVTRHARATRCRVELVVNARCELTIADNGRGADVERQATRPGAGWMSMRERAAELGGSCSISSGPEGGIVVRASVPIDNHPAEAAAVEVHG